MDNVPVLVCVGFIHKIRDSIKRFGNSNLTCDFELSQVQDPRILTYFDEGMLFDSIA